MAASLGMTFAHAIAARVECIGDQTAVVSRMMCVLGIRLQW